MDHVIYRLDMWRRLLGPIVFKIGIAADIRHRYWNSEFGYHREGIWHFMDVVLEGRADICRDMEKSLIHAFRRIPGCYNERPGGEGVSPHCRHMCRVYLVVAEAASGIGLGTAHAQRQRSRSRAAGMACAVGMAGENTSRR